MAETSGDDSPAQSADSGGGDIEQHQTEGEDRSQHVHDNTVGRDLNIVQELNVTVTSVNPRVSWKVRNANQERAQNVYMTEIEIRIQDAFALSHLATQVEGSAIIDMNLSPAGGSFIQHGSRGEPTEVEAHASAMAPLQSTYIMAVRTKRPDNLKIKIWGG